MWRRERDNSIDRRNRVVWQRHSQSRNNAAHTVAHNPDCGVPIIAKASRRGSIIFRWKPVILCAQITQHFVNKESLIFQGATMKRRKVFVKVHCIPDGGA